ncbi:response regulator transcription factor [Demequina sp.]|uniref:response regulator transcription factor n=1 Tax=Demequina sp. TaxID=2050685 RepID=UPI003D0DCB61
MTTILIVEDEQRIASFVEKGLRAEGFTTLWAPTGADGIFHATEGDADLIVLDLGLPDIDGLDALASMRGQGVTTPVIVLTARTTPSATLASLEGGADDYMPKPFRFEELLARIRLRLRAAAPVEQSAHILTHGDIALDLKERTIRANGVTSVLTAREFALAETFLRNPGAVLSRAQLLSRVWGYDFDPNSNVVDVYVRYLRKKIGTDRLETVRGMGYRLT